ncbi:MAG: succinate dehydrogenase [Calditrichaeota bacterium]|nr:MAG: succinate dehydrogenase [Calditrichota bacterium]
MPALPTSLWSSVARKALMALTGLALIGFLIVHLLGNLILLSGNADAFNLYSNIYASMGSFLYVIEAGLVAFFLIHIVSGITVALGKMKARPVSYKKVANAGGPSRKTVSSVTMIYTGVLLLVFLVFHVVSLKYGAHYDTTIGGEKMRDLYKLVVENFQQPYIVAGYVIIMTLLGFHLRHGFWSAFQSLGALQPRFSNMIYIIGVFIAIILAIGFLFVPIWIFLNS